MLKNKLYLFDKWLSEDRTLLILLLIGSSTVMTQFESTMFLGIFLLLIICSWVVFVKAKILGGQWKLDKSVYDVPQEGEVIVTTKDFYWDGSLKTYHVQSHTSKPNTIFIKKGTEFKIIIILEGSEDWTLSLHSQDGINIVLTYFESRKYYKTKSQIREDKLKKLLK